MILRLVFKEENWILCMIDIDFIVQNHNKIQWRVNQMTPLSSIFFALIIAFSCLFSQQGKYTRKSVSSLESVWVKQGGLSGVSKFDYATFDKFIDFYVEVERFDYNVLPNKMLKDFRSEARSKSDITPVILAEVLESTVVNKIISILNDPEVSQKRGTAMKDESAFQSFAATKAKSLGLTADELAVLMNSAYIYLPFISSMKQVVEGNDISIKINGGLIWWQVKDDGSGNVSVEQILSVETMATSSLDRTAKYPITEKPMYTKFNFGAEEWNTTPEQYAQNDAMLAFAKNLGVKTKKIDAFKLSAQIVEASGKKYGFPLGFREGVHLDDGFDLVEYTEDEEGNEIAQRVGYVRVKKTGDNVKDPTSFTYARQLLGSRQDVGGVVMEHPTLGIDLRMNFGMVTGMNIEQKHTYVYGPLLFLWGSNLFSTYEGDMDALVEEWNSNPFYSDMYGNIAPALQDDATSTIGGNLLFSYNLAPIIGISQTFLTTDIGFAIPTALPNTDATAATMVISPYFGLTKRLGGKVSFALDAAAGMDVLTMAGTTTLLGESYSFSLGVVAPGVKFGGELGYMLSPDLLFNIGASYKMGMAPVITTYTFNEEDLTEYIDTYSTTLDYSTLRMGGLGINMGVTYAVGELPFNLFGFLDPFKKH